MPRNGRIYCANNREKRLPVPLACSLVGIRACFIPRTVALKVRNSAIAAVCCLLLRDLLRSPFATNFRLRFMASRRISSTLHCFTVKLCVKLVPARAAADVVARPRRLCYDPSQLPAVAKQAPHIYGSTGAHRRTKGATAQGSNCC